MEEYIILEDEYEIYLSKKKELIKRESELWNEKNMAVEQTSETYHDNPAFDEVEMQQRMLSKQWQDLNKILNNAKVLTLDVINSLPNDKVRVWKKVLLDVDWEENEFTIWWYQTPINWRISYNVPLIRPLLGREEWDDFEIVIAWKKKVIEILEIDSI